VSPGARRRQIVAAVFLTAGLSCLSLGAVLELSKVPLAGAALVVAGLIAWKPAYSWTAALTGLFLVILFIPMRKYVVSGGLPFQPEPYRLVLLLVVAGWTLSLLADPRVRLRRTRMDAAVLGLALAICLSLAANLDRVDSLQANVTKAVAVFATYVVLFFVITSVVGGRDVHRLIKVLVGGGAIIAALAVAESRLGYNPYDAVLTRVPLFTSLGLEHGVDHRGSRVAGPAQHPIALGAALAMLLPLGLYLAYTTRRRHWWIASLLIALAGFSTLARTTIVMFVVIAAVFFWLRRAEAVRAAPVVLPLVVAVHFFVPGALGTMKLLFFPEGGLLAEHSNTWAPVDRDLPTWCSFAGRAEEFVPVVKDGLDRPFFGLGYGTRITVEDPATGVKPNACILDNQWLGTFQDAGLVGVLAWAWLLIRFVRRGGAAAKEADEETSLLLTAIVASVAAFGVAMFLYDAFAFTQVMLLLFILLAFGARTLQSVDVPEPVVSESGVAGVPAGATGRALEPLPRFHESLPTPER
jgi:polysaccharide biosynthesis protein PslJ